MKRRMSKLFGIAAVSLALMGAPDAKADAAFKTGNDLARVCRTQDGVMSPHCVGYLQGAADMAATTSTMFCLQKGTTAVQLWLTVWNFMQAHPQDMNRPAGLLSFAAWTQAFPCPKARTSSRRQDPTS